jgi:putative ABC transport system ATP-binding protein
MISVVGVESAATEAPPQVAERPFIIELDQLHKIYSTGVVDVHALRGVSLTVRRGEFIAIMGASGSGKSTLMNIVGCLDRPTKGAYILDGEDVSHLSKDERADIRNRRIGFVFQNFNLLPRTSALENVELPLIYANVPSAESNRLAREALAAVGLGGREENHPNQLSGGEQQRVAIARALVNNPVLILADEPTGNLDSRTSIEIMEILQRLNREHGITIIIVTHEPDIARYVKRVVMMRDGWISRDEQIAYPRDAQEDLISMPVSKDEEVAA